MEQERKRRVRYKGTHPRNYREKYKELNPEKYQADVEKIIQSGKTPAGTHIPIMVREILDFLQIQPGQVGYDATLGYGGHSRKMLERLQGQGHLSPAPLLGEASAPAVQGNVPGDLPQKGSQAGRTGGGNGIPGRKVCIADAFLPILGAGENAAGDLKAIMAVFIVGFLDRLFRAPEIKRDDLAVLQNQHLLITNCKGLTPIKA